MSENDLWYSKFHKVIKTGDNLTILSATEEGLIFGNGQVYGALVQAYPKSVSIFAEKVTLCDEDPVEKITFGSTIAEVVTLSTTSLVVAKGSSESPTKAVVSARGSDGKSNDAGGENGRDATHGKPGNRLNVFIGQAPSSLGDSIVFDARGGNGGTTNEEGQGAGNGATGGKATVLVSSTWIPIIHDLESLMDLLEPGWREGFGLDDDDDDDDDDDNKPTEDNSTLPQDVVGRIVGTFRNLCRLCQDDDPISEEVVSKLAPLCDPDTEYPKRETLSTLKDVHKELSRAFSEQSLKFKHSVQAPGGFGGSGSRKLGKRGEPGKKGAVGTVDWKVLKSKSAAGPLDFPPLHPLQCQMQLDKAAALFYLGDEDCLFAAQRVLARLYAKMAAVIDLEEDDSEAVRGLTEKAQEARKKRLNALKEVYQSHRDLISIPKEMRDPVGELRRIGREAGYMLFQITGTSVDYYGYQENWAPRQSVEAYEQEARDSVDALKKSEEIFLRLASHLDKTKTDQQTRLDMLKGYEDGRTYIGKERQRLVDQLDDLNRRIQSQVLKAEIQRRAEAVTNALQNLANETQTNFEIGVERFFKSLGNVGKEIKVSDLIKKREKKEKKKKDDKDGGKVGKKGGDKSDAIRPVRHAPLPPTAKCTVDQSSDTDLVTTQDKKDDKKKKELNLKRNFKGVGKAIFGKAAGEAGEMIWDGFMSVPSVDGTRVEKSLILRQIKNIVGDLAKVAESSKAKTTKDPKTGLVTVDEEQEKLLVASQTQIDKFIEGFEGVSRLSPVAKIAREALKAYADILTDRNHDRVQYNLALKAIVTLDSQIDDLQARERKLEDEGYQKDNTDQLGQMAQMAQDIYSWNRARTMRLISQYGRAIRLATLEIPKDIEAGGRLTDAALSLTAIKLEALNTSRRKEMFEGRGKAGHDVSRFGLSSPYDRGRFVHFAREDIELLLNKDPVSKRHHMRITLPAPGREFADDDAPDLRGYADVRVYRVRFWLNGVKANRGVVPPGEDPIVKIGITHEGDSIYYHPDGGIHVFAHDPIELTWSYRLLLQPSDKRNFEIVDNGNIVSDDGTPAYAAPSPFATWTISLLDPQLLDLSEVTGARLEFCGTTRAFK